MLYINLLLSNLVPRAFFRIFEKGPGNEVGFWGDFGHILVCYSFWHSITKILCRLYIILVFIVFIVPTPKSRNIYDFDWFVTVNLMRGETEILYFVVTTNLSINMLKFTQTLTMYLKSLQNNDFNYFWMNFIHAAFQKLRSI